MLFQRDTQDSRSVMLQAWPLRLFTPALPPAIFLPCSHPFLFMNMAQADVSMRWPKVDAVDS